MHFVLREIERNIPATNIRKWNVMDSMRGIAVMWESIKSTAIQNYIFKCGFGIKDSVVSEGDDLDKSGWVILQGHIDFPSNFFRFLNVDQLLPTTEDHTATSWTSLKMSVWHVSRKRRQRGRRCNCFWHVQVRKMLLWHSQCWTQ